MKTTRRNFLGGVAATSFPAVTAGAATVIETQEEKCIRLTQELLVEFRQIELPDCALFGAGRNLRFGNGDSLRYGRSEDDGEILWVSVQHAVADR